MMGTLNRLNDPIDTPKENFIDHQKEEHMARGTHLRMRCIGPRYASIDVHKGLFGKK
jgi:hypothetical protein